MAEILDLIGRARTGAFDPVQLLLGTERFLIERAQKLLRAASLGDSPPGFNDDLFHGNTAVARNIVSAARTLPMLAKARFILVRDVDSMATAEMDALAAYIEDPSPSTCLVMVGEKLDGRSKLSKVATKKGLVFEANPLRAGAMRGFVESESKRRGHVIASDAADALIDATGQDLSALDDALERLSLYVGEGKRIEVAAVEQCIAHVRVESIWALVDAVGRRDLRTALRASSSLLADREPPLRILALLTRQVRMVARMRDALSRGMAGPDAAKHAGAPPFKARELTEAARRFTDVPLRNALTILAETDLALKGSKRPGELVLEEALTRLCT